MEENGAHRDNLEAAQDVFGTFLFCFVPLSQPLRVSSLSLTPYVPLTLADTSPPVSRCSHHRVPLPSFTCLFILSVNVVGAVPVCAKALWGQSRERAASSAREGLRATAVMAERCRPHRLHTVHGAQQTTHRPFPQRPPRLQESKDMEKFTLT